MQCENERLSSIIAVLYVLRTSKHDGGGAERVGTNYARVSFVQWNGIEMNIINWWIIYGLAERVEQTR